MLRYVRDGLASLLAIGIGVITLAKALEWDWSIVRDWSSAIAFIGILGAGIVAVTIGELNRQAEGVMLTNIILAAFAVVVAVWGFIIDSMVAFFVLAATLAAYWLVAMFSDWYYSPSHMRKQVLSH